MYSWINAYTITQHSQNLSDFIRAYYKNRNKNMFGLLLLIRFNPSSVNTLLVKYFISNSVCSVVTECASSNWWTGRNCNHFSILYMGMFYVAYITSSALQNIEKHFKLNQKTVFILYLGNFRRYVFLRHLLSF